MAVFRGQGEMEVEVHLSDDPTEDVQTKTPEETPKSETGWTRFGCSCYYVSNMITSWGASRRDCQQRGADLVVINTIEEQKFLFTFGKTVWMGLSDSAVEGTWTWVDGTPLTTAYWRSGQPDNSKDRSEEGQDCAAISSRFPDPVTRWYDTLCGEPLYWVCERGI